MALAEPSWCLSTKGVPTEIPIHGLRPNTAYRYRFYFGKARRSLVYVQSEEYGFHTQRAPGAVHFLSPCRPTRTWMKTHRRKSIRRLLRICLTLLLFSDRPRDTFITHKRREDFKLAFPQYLAQRYYFGLIGRSAPVFLALGNHDGEGGSRDGGAMSDWSLANRKKYFPNPEPDSFFTGNKTLQDYYAFTWGDAIFIVLDPFWPTQTGRGQSTD